MTSAVITHRLTKTYHNKNVVSDLDLNIPEGEIYGFLGPNGAGKSTTMKMLVGLVQPTSGTVEIFGKPMDLRSRQILARDIGALIEAPSIYGHLTGRENMSIVEHLLGLTPTQTAKAVHIVRMDGQLDKKVKNYSLGMKQRLGIAMALARNPRLLVLDEPTNGLDPAGIEEIRDLLIYLAMQEGITVMISSHILSEIDKAATSIGIIQDGRLIFQGTKRQLMNQTVPAVLIGASDPDRVMGLFEGSTRSLHHDAVRIPGVLPQQTPELVRNLVGHDIDIETVTREDQSLEDVFIRLTGREGQL